MLLCFATGTYAQTPQGINYQAVVRTANGVIAANSSVTFRFTFREGSAAGAIKYVETFVETTDAYGMANVVLGSGVQSTGTFADVDWTKSNFLTTEVDLTGTFEDLGTKRFQSVPYALNAGGGNWTVNGNNIHNSNSGNVGIGTSAPLDVLHVAAQQPQIRVEGQSVNSSIFLTAPSSSATGGVGTGSNHGLPLFTNGQDRLMVTADGNVGISDMAPTSKFVVEDLTGGGTLRPTAVVRAHNCGAPCGQPEYTQALNLQNENTTDGNAIGIGFSDTGERENPSAWMGAQMIDKTSHYASLKFSTKGNSIGAVTRMTIRENGFVGIGTLDPATTMHVNHPSGVSNGFSISNATDQDRWHFYTWSTNNLSLYFNGAQRGTFNNTSGNYTSVSDRRLKTNIQDIGNVMAKVKQLDVKRYTFISDKTNQPFFGLIAQEVEGVFPELVTHETADEQDIYTMDYSGFGIIAIKAIQEQAATIETLESKLAKQEMRIAKLEAAILGQK